MALYTPSSSHQVEQEPALVTSSNAPSWQQRLACGALAAAVTLASQPGAALAREKIGEFAANGLVFKDSVEVTALDDPGVPGVTLYITDFKRSLSDRLKGDFFTDPSQASITCTQTGPIVISDYSRLGGPEGQEVFSEKKNLALFNDKTQRVRRVYDKERHTLVYIAYSTRTLDDKVTAGRYKTSVCALPIVQMAPPAGVADAAGAELN